MMHVVGLDFMARASGIVDKPMTLRRASRGEGIHTGSRKLANVSRFVASSDKPLLPVKPVKSDAKVMINRRLR